MNVIEYVDHIKAVKLKHTERLLLALYDHLFSHNVLHVKNKNGDTYIVDFIVDQ